MLSIAKQTFHKFDEKFKAIKELERIAFVDDLIIKAHVAGSLVAALVEEPKGSHPVLWQQVTQW